jgi:hypothetical protein
MSYASFGPCCLCNVETDTQWGTSIGRPHFVCRDCGSAALEKCCTQQQEWLNSGRCTCCGDASLSPRAGEGWDQLCGQCIWPASLHDAAS